MFQLFEKMWLLNVIFRKKKTEYIGTLGPKLKFLHMYFTLWSQFISIYYLPIWNLGKWWEVRVSHMKNIHKIYKNKFSKNKKLKSIFEIGQYMRWSFYHFLYRVLNWYSAQHWCNHKSKWHYSLGLGDQKWQNSHSRRCTFDPGL